MAYSQCIYFYLIISAAHKLPTRVSYQLLQPASTHVGGIYPRLLGRLVQKGHLYCRSASGSVHRQRHPRHVATEVPELYPTSFLPMGSCEKRTYKREPQNLPDLKAAVRKCVRAVTARHGSLETFGSPQRHAIAHLKAGKMVSPNMSPVMPGKFVLF